MRVLLSSYGSRGDVEPLAGLALALKTQGADAVVSAPGDREFVDLLTRANVEMAPAFMPVREWIDSAKRAPADLATYAARMLPRQYASLSSAATGCDAILATGLMPSVAAAMCVSEVMALPFFHVSLCPLYLPSHHTRPIPNPHHPPTPGVTDPRALWEANAKATQAVFGPAVNKLRASIGLLPVDNIRDRVFTAHPYLAVDPVLWPWAPTDLCDAAPTGAWILPDARALPGDLEDFLAAGPPPVYVGFGSIALQSTKDAGRIAIDAIRAAGRRIIVQRGWAELGLIDDQPDCLAIGEVNQQTLFQRVAAVVHHGGAGTTTTAARAGAPQVIVPQIVDQPYWAARVAALGVGAAHNGATPTTASLSEALKIALSSETGMRATDMAGLMRGNGANIAARLLIDALR